MVRHLEDCIYPDGDQKHGTAFWFHGGMFQDENMEIVFTSVGLKLAPAVTRHR